MTYIYVATRIITYFGTELRVLWEQIVCRFLKIPQEDTRTFKATEMCGHVEHELLKTLTESFLMCFVPFFMNFILGICILLTGSYRVFYIGDISIPSIVFLVAGISLLANCAPSFEDALSFKDYLYSKDTSLFVKIILTPHFAVSYAAAFLERYSVTFVLAILFAWVFPTLFSFTFPLINQILN
ncbi:MAG: hypothetical protein IKJ86_08930 [Clostridia bacterium]|nr:hypothetical protein [Clostridia bacterium]